jgi:hypothetical protein
MRDLLRILALIAALCIAAIGLLLGVIGIAVSLLSSSGPDRLTMVTLSVSLLVLSLGLGLASAWHIWRAIQGYPSAAFRPKRIWLLVVLFLLALVLGQAILSLSLLPALTFPLLHIAAAVLPALIILALIGRSLRGATTWRDLVLQVASGAFIATPLAFVLEAIAILLLATAAFLGLAWRPGGQDLLLTVATYMQDPSWVQDLGALAPDLITPVVIAAAFALVAGLIPLVEEAVKTIGVVLMAYRRPSLPQTVLWGLAGGAGFAIAEGLLNATGGLGAWLPVILLRVGTTLLHCLTGALMGLAWYQILSRRRWSRGLGLYLVSVTIHGLWNGLAVAMALLSLETLGAGTTSSGQLVAGLGTITVLLLLAVLALGMAAGLAGLTIYVRQWSPAPAPLGDDAATSARETLSFEDLNSER